MARKKNQPLWEEDEFVDISSSSRGRPAATSASRRQPRSFEEYPGEYGRPARKPRPAGPGGSGSRRNTPPRRPPKKKRSKRGDKARKFLVAVTLLVMVAATALLCIFLLFKVSLIEVTGDVVYSEEDILNICRYEVGDNLFFISTDSKEEELKEKLPYIQDVEIRRHLPGTIEIHVTGAQVAASVSTGEEWLWVDSAGKILDRQASAQEGTLQVAGLIPIDSATGRVLQVEDAGLQEAYRQILEEMDILGALDSFTRLDLTDQYDISLWYEDRVECKLGNAADLPYKLEFGWSILSDTTKISSNERGVLDLSYAQEAKRANFTVDTGSAVTSSGSASTPPNDGTSGTDDGSDVSSQDGGQADAGDDNSDDTGDSGRGGEIPDSIYTG